MYEYFNFDYEKATFSWDEEKARSNFMKHGIRFETASKVFADTYKLIRPDLEHTQEERYNVLGKVGKIIFVVCVFYDNNNVRIISARLASVPEKERYENGRNQNE
jgi:hypothetical protein